MEEKNLGKLQRNGPVEIVGRRKVIGAMGVLASSLLLPGTLRSEPLRVNENSDNLRVLSFSSLKEAKQSSLISIDMLVKTSGYHRLGDGGGASYYISNHAESKKVNEGDVVQFSNELVGLMLLPDSVNYKMFGAVGDSKNDDGVQMRIAHTYANLHGIPVRNLNGEYWIDKARNIVVKTLVEWGHSIFHINERFNTKSPVFRVQSSEKRRDIEVSDAVKVKITESIKPGVQHIPELSQYKNSLIIIEDENDRTGFRAGARYGGPSRPKQEMFYVEEDGRIIGDIAWSFKDFTRLSVYAAEKNYLIIDGGTFLLSGDNHPEEEKKGYFQNGFSVTRSRTIIRNQWVGLEEGKSDIAYNPRNGFYNFNTVYEVLLENVRLIPWEQDRPGTKLDLYAGTYGIGGSRMLNSTFRNVTAEGSLLHWGVFGTNMNKNFRIENCKLNRVDVHFHCWNLTIKDSAIGNRTTSVTGGGELLIENTSCEGRNFLNLRWDYGAKWDGNITIKNCRFKPHRSEELFVVRSRAGDFNYGYPIGLARNIHIDGFIIDYSNIPESNHPCWLVETSNHTVSKEGKRHFFPTNLIFKNIFVQGREKGVRIMNVPDPKGYALGRRGSYDGSFLEHNSYLEFNNIQLEKIQNESEDQQYHFQFITESESLEYDNLSLYPKVHFSNCNALAVNLGGAIAEVMVENSTINHFYTTKEKSMPGELVFSNCKFLPFLSNDTNKPFEFSNELGASFINCTFLLPRRNGQRMPELLPLLDFIKINESVLYNHINSRLGKDILEHLKSKNTTLTPMFIAMLKSHHELV